MGLANFIPPIVVFSYLGIIHGDGRSMSMFPAGRLSTIGVFHQGKLNPILKKGQENYLYLANI